MSAQGVTLIIGRPQPALLCFFSHGIGHGRRKSHASQLLPSEGHELASSSLLCYELHDCSDSSAVATRIWYLTGVQLPAEDGHVMHVHPALCVPTQIMPLAST